MQDGADKRRGVIVGFALAGLQRRLASSPAAIYHSLRRRTERLEKQAAELAGLPLTGTVPVAEPPRVFVSPISKISISMPTTRPRSKISKTP